MHKICPCCNNAAPFRLKKGNTDYFQCVNCKTLFSLPLDNDNLVGGGAHEERNTQQNHIRIERIDALFKRHKKSDVQILDFGCGFFRLGNDLIAAGYNCDGFDAYNEDYRKLPEKNKYHLITAVELIEHTASPYLEIDVMYRSLLPNGIVMLESSFTDVANEEGIELEDFFYVSPEAGHSTIFSHHGLDVLMSLRGLKPMAHWNRHVRAFQKIGG